VVGTTLKINVIVLYVFLLYLILLYTVSPVLILVALILSYSIFMPVDVVTVFRLLMFVIKIEEYMLTRTERWKKSP
jgi:hypothetical protein